MADIIMNQENLTIFARWCLIALAKELLDTIVCTRYMTIRKIIKNTKSDSTHDIMPCIQCYTYAIFLNSDKGSSRSRIAP